MIEKYFIEIEQTISFFKNIKSYSLSRKIYNNKQGYIKGDIVFNDDTVLEFAEVIDIDFKSKIKYRYHFMDANRNIIFRYDNAKHHKEIKTYPHHKHQKNEVLECNEMSIFDVLLEIKGMSRKNN